MTARTTTDPIDALDEARRDRQRAFDRITWWEVHRHEALIPLAIAFFGAGFGVGYLAHLALGAPSWCGYAGGVASLFGSGRLVDRLFSMTILDRLDARIARLERERTRRAPSP